MRAEFSKRTRLDAFDRANGHCEECGNKLRIGYVEYHHGSYDRSDNSLGNVVVLCRFCHRAITRERAPIIAKSNRIRERVAGIKRIRGRPLPGTRRSGWKHKVNGTWERRT
jgi:5-methylcytosine-specific restriction enzyme A